MLGKNRIRKIERLFGFKFRVDTYSSINTECKHYFKDIGFICLYFFKHEIWISLSSIPTIYRFKNSEFYKVLQIIHEYLYDRRDNN